MYLMSITEPLTNHFRCMKEKIIVPILVAFFMSTSCNEKKDKTEQAKDEPVLFPSELVDFVPAAKAPVFSGTGTDTWDKMIRERGYILKENGIYKMWYTGFGDSHENLSLGYATSTDGMVWKRYSEQPIFDGYWTEDVQVVKHNGTYSMVAEGVDDIAHMLSSTDGIHWTRMGDLDIRKVNGEPIGPGAYGTPTLWVEDEKWYLFYERGDLGIWVATSADQKVWTNVQDEPVIELGPGKYDAEGVAVNQIIKHQGRYYAYYHGTPDEDWATWNCNVAVSDDLIHWSKYGNNPIIVGDSITNNYSSPILVHDGDKYRLYTMHGAVRVFFPKEH